MPFGSAAFDLVVSNHSLEHFVELEPTLREIGRVMRPGGTLYIAVPNTATLSDRIYRWLARGGGHVNPFRNRKRWYAWWTASLACRTGGPACCTARCHF